MKILTILFTILPIISFTQQPQLDSLSHWETKFVILHPNGYTDTVWIGLNENGGNGYQSGLDVIDTILDLPVSIVANDPQVHDEFGLGSQYCVNLKRDIRGFEEGITSYYLYVRSDSFFMGDLSGNPPTMPELQIKYFNQKFEYSNKSYFISQATLYNINSDFGAPDYNENGIYGVPPFGTTLDSVQLFLWPPINPIFSCQTQSDVVLLRVDITIEKITGIKQVPTETSIKVYPNPFREQALLVIKNFTQERTHFEMHIYDMLGRKVRTVEIRDTQTTIYRNNLNQGMYFYILNKGGKKITTGKFMIY